VGFVPLKLKENEEVFGEKLKIKLDVNDVSMKEIKRITKDKKYEIISGDGFDVWIKGEVKDGIYNFSIINWLGDRIDIEEKEWENFKKRLINFLEYSYIKKKILIFEKDKKPFRFEIWVNVKERNDFEIGEKIEFNFYSDESKYLTILNIDKEGVINVLFPNKFYNNNLIEGKKQYKIPNDEMKKEFEFQFFEPAGEETVVAIGTKEKLDFINNFGEKESNEIGSITIKGDKRFEFLKSFEKILSSDNLLNEDIIVIRSHKKGGKL